MSVLQMAFLGQKTKTGVIAFQTVESLSADGIVGPITANALNTAYGTPVALNQLEPGDLIFFSIANNGTV